MYFATVHVSSTSFHPCLFISLAIVRLHVVFVLPSCRLHSSFHENSGHIQLFSIHNIFPIQYHFRLVTKAGVLFCLSESFSLGHMCPDTLSHRRFIVCNCHSDVLPGWPTAGVVYDLLAQHVWNGRFFLVFCQIASCINISPQTMTLADFGYRV